MKGLLIGVFFAIRGFFSTNQLTSTPIFQRVTLKSWNGPGDDAAIV